MAIEGLVSRPQFLVQNYFHFSNPNPHKRGQHNYMLIWVIKFLCDSGEPYLFLGHRMNFILPQRLLRSGQGLFYFQHVAQCLTPRYILCKSMKGIPKEQEGRISICSSFGKNKQNLSVRWPANVTLPGFGPISILSEMVHRHLLCDTESTLGFGAGGS